MRSSWSRDVLARRIDRCYLIAARTKIADKRERYIGLARDYRAQLANPVLRAPAA
ncbi:hypothetical protein H7F51_11535 [Novosphingobium flavum]|uniref:Transposase n=1 Tax=Novosphingobium flavum TaxID=1778672 RepID=A0A7X1KMB8_9SPHN|nr:hypothetical protein [Novosphingobium flavum]MBC2666150.1 hypothetical protein [Novosphingobium flavum]